MERSTVTSFQLRTNRSVALDYGVIDVSDDSKDRILIFTGREVIDDAIAAYLPSCDRSTQERFMQILTDHIRKTENSH